MQIYKKKTEIPNLNLGFYIKKKTNKNFMRISTPIFPIMHLHVLHYSYHTKLVLCTCHFLFRHNICYFLIYKIKCVVFHHY